MQHGQSALFAVKKLHTTDHDIMVQTSEHVVRAGTDEPDILSAAAG